MLICLMLLSVQESLARRRIENGCKVQVIFGGRVQPLCILEASDQIPVLAAVNTEEKTMTLGCKLCYRCYIDLHCKTESNVLPTKPFC